MALGACMSVPSQEMSDARRALDAAVHADARRLLPITIGRASATLDRANDALRAGQYDEARVLARAAQDEAIAARQLAIRLVQIRQGLAEVRDQGQEWRHIEQLVQRALALARAGDTGGALLTSEQAQAALQ